MVSLTYICVFRNFARIVDARSTNIDRFEDSRKSDVNWRTERFAEKYTKRSWDRVVIKFNIAYIFNFNINIQRELVPLSQCECMENGVWCLTFV